MIDTLNRVHGEGRGDYFALKSFVLFQSMHTVFSVIPHRKGKICVVLASSSRNSQKIIFKGFSNFSLPFGCVDSSSYEECALLCGAERTFRLLYLHTCGQRDLMRS